MGIYSSQALGCARTTVEVEPQYYSESMDIMETTFCIVAESENNWNTFMKAVGLQELAYLEAYGEEMVYTEGAVGDFFARAKDWFKKLFAKVKGLFEKFMAKIRSLISSDSSFVSKYEDKIREGAGKVPSSAEFKGYPYTNIHKFKMPSLDTEMQSLGSRVKGINPKYIDKLIDGRHSNQTGNLEQLKKDIEELKDEKLHIDRYVYDEVRGDIIAAGTGKQQRKCSSSDFVEEFTEALRGDKETFDDRYLSDYSKFVNEIRTSSESINKAKEDFNTMKDNINEAISDIEEWESKLKDDRSTYEDNVNKRANDDKMADADLKSNNMAFDYALDLAKTTGEVMKNVLQIATTANGIHLNLMKAYRNQCKAICVKLVGFASRQSSENASYNYFQSESPVSGIRLV